MNSQHRRITHRTRLLVDEALDAVRRGFVSDDSCQRPVELRQLEQRLLMSATPAAVVADAPDAATTTADAANPDDVFDTPVANSDAETAADESSSDTTTNTESDVQATVELVVIDPSAADYEQLVGDLQSQTDRAFEILVLNPRQDGISQITDALQNRTGVSAIHLVSHGDDGEILLGTSVLSQRNIDRYAAELITWQRSLTTDADLLIYGCDLAASDSGIALTESLNILLGTDIAASDDLTGHASLGGDWDLEVGVGVIETTVAFTAELQGTWQSLLTLNAYEGFDYATGSLNGRNGGTGWASGWSTVASSAQVVGTGLTTPAGLPAGMGGAAELNTTLIFTQDRDLTTTLGADGTTAWFSFLLKADGTSGGLSLVIGDGAGADNTVNVGTSDNDFLVSKDGSPIGERISNAVVDGQTYFLAVQIDFTSGNDTVTLYLDPSAGETAPDSLPAATAQLTTADLGTFTQIGLLGGFAGNNSQIDEIRVGTTFADVAGGTANVAPDLDLPSGPLNYNGGDPLTVIDGAATVADPDSGNFDTGQLTVAFTANSTSDDRLEIDTSGDFNLSGSDVRYQPGGPPTTIGTWTGGTDGSTPLVITFNTDATRAIVEELVRNIGYRNVAASPSELSRTVEFQLTDDLGAASNTEAVTINMLGINAAPMNSVPGTQSTPVDTSLTFSTGNSNLISISDVDAGAATVEVTLTATNGTVTVDLPFDAATATGPEFTLSSSSNGLQQDTQVARLSDGRFVVVWSGNGSSDSDGIWMRQFNADQTPVGNQIRLNGNGAKADPQSEPSVAVNDAGRIVVSWTSYDQDAALTDGVYFRAMNWDGTSDTGEIAANTHTAGDQNDSVVEIDAAGNIIVVWTDKDELDGQNEGVFARRFNAAGTAIDANEWLVNTETISKQRAADIAMHSDGSFAIVWESQNQEAGGTQYGIFGKRYDASANELDAPGTPGVSEFQVNVTTFKNQHVPSIAMDGSGNFVVVWASQDQAGDGDDDGIFGQLYDSAGNKTGPIEFQISTATAWDQTNPSVAMDANGDFVVVWEHDTSDVGPKDIRFQQFDNTATKVGPETTANDPTTGQQNAPDVAMDATGNFVIVWDGQTTSETDGVIGRHYDVPLAPVTFSVGDGLADSTTTFQGTIASVNGVLDGLIFNPTPTFVGTASLQIITDDLGNTGFGGSKLDDDTVNITVTGANTPIGAISDTNGTANTVAENATPGTAVGVTAFADDVDAGDTVSYGLDNDAGGLFEVHSTTGVVTVKAALDYETATSHNITVRATSTDSSTTTQGFTITVNPVNDNAPVITSGGGGASAAVNVAENSATVTTVTATDADLPAQTLSYSISGGADQAKFDIDSSSGMLTFVTAPDFESPTDAGADNVYDVQVQVSDGLGGTDTQDITVTVTNVFEGILIVDTTADVLDGNVTSAQALLDNKGADGKISLREALAALNATANVGVPDEIHFNFADSDAGHLYYKEDFAAGLPLTPSVTALDDGSITDFDSDYPYAQHSWFRIDLNNALPQLEITDAVVINGYTQAGSSQNTLAIGNDAVLRVELTNSSGDSNRGITVEAGGAGSSILGLVINSFGGSGILTEPGADNVTIQGNFLGTDVTGTIDAGNGDAGVHLRSSGNMVGGANLTDRNVISGNQSRGVTTYTFGPIVTGNVVRNNYIGTDVTGVLALGNAGDAGVQIYNNDGLQLLDNVIAASSGDGVWLRNSSSVDGTIIQGNLIGVGADGTTSVANAGHGIWIEENTSSTTIGGLLAGQGNTIANSGGDGIAITNGSGTTIRGNAIYNNAGLGIDLNDNGVTSNDLDDLDGGPNSRQNFPVLTSAVGNGTDLTIVGSLNSSVLSTFQVDFYASSAADPSGYGEAQRYLGSATVSTNVLGTGLFSELLSGVSVAAGESITATATDSSGNTSEFAQNIVATNANTAPAITSNGGGSSAAINVVENSTAVTTVTATDPEAPPQTLSYSISGGADQLLFSIDSGTGVLTFNSAPDFESPTDAGANNVYDVQVQVSDGAGGTDTQMIAVTVTDTNDNTPVITSGQTFNVSESAANGTSPGTAVATDADAGTTFSSWAITAGNTDGIFAINAATGQITVADNSNLDFETTTGYTLSLTVADGTNTSATETVAITVTPTNDNTPVITAGQTFNVSESAANGTSPGTVVATDADAGTTFSGWAITAGNTDGIFAINAATGQITVADNSNLDFETTTGYTLSLTVADGTNTSATETVAIAVTAANDNSPVITSSSSVAVPENTPTLVTLTATDADLPGQSISFSIIGGDDAALMHITGSNTLMMTAPADFEMPLDADGDNVYEVQIQADDGNGRTSVQFLSVTITDSNDNIPVVTSGQIFSVSEIAPNGTALGSVTATDADAGTTFSSWTITGGNTDGIFAVNAATGALTVVDNTNLDIAVTSMYLLDITVSDGLNTSTARTVQVNVTPGPNTAPIAMPDNYTVSEGAILNVLAGSGVLSNDTDADGDSLTASLISGPAYAAGFTLNADGSFTYQHNGSETTSDTFTYSVSDGTVAATTTVIMTVTPVNDNPTLTAFSDVTIPEDTAFGPVAFTVADSETASTSLLVTATSSVQGLISDSAIVISGSGASRTLSFTPVPDATGGPATITVSVSDGVNSTSTTFDVSITAVYVAPALPVAGPPVTDSSTQTDQTPTNSNPQSNSSDSDNSSLSSIVAAAATPSSQDNDDDDAIPPPVQRNSSDHTADFVPVAQIVVEASADPVMLDQIDVTELDFDRVRASSLKTLAQHAATTIQHSISVDTTGSFPNSVHLTYQDFAELKETAGRIDEFQENLKSEYRLTDMTASTVAVAGTSIVIGTVVTALRTGMLALGFLSQLPVWTLFDPLLVMDGVSGGDDGDSLQDIIDRQDAAQQE